MKFVGIKNNRIVLVSDNKFSNNNLDIIELPKELENLSNDELLLDVRYRNGSFSSKNFPKDISKLKIAVITNYKQQCGISTYAEHLLPFLLKDFGDWKLFVEETENPTSNFNILGNEIVDDAKIVQCWKRDQSLLNLSEKIIEYNPDIVFINMEWGIFPNARYFMSLLTQLSDYKIFCTLHSVYPSHFDKSIVENSMQNIIVHLDEAKTALLNKGSKSNIEVIPHACYEYENVNKLWNFYKTEHTFIQVGFAFKYKCFETSILAASILKEKYNDVYLTIIFSESEFAKHEHEQYYQELINLVNKLNLQENVSIIRGFQSELSLQSYLRTNKIAVFPYKTSHPDHLCLGSSGAARLAMALGLPAISSRIPHFSDLPTIKISNENELACELDKLFLDNQAINLQIKKQFEFIKENSWANVAKKYIEFFIR